VSCVIFSTCATKQELTTDISLTDISGEVNFTDMFDDFIYIPLETSEKSLFSTVNKMIVHENKFYIMDMVKMKQIFVFHNDGTFSHTIGSKGEGPGEYMNIEDFTIDTENNRVVVLSYPSIIYTYDMSGVFMERKVVSNAMLWSICNYENGFICSTNHQSATSGADARLIFMFDKNFNLQYKLFDVLPVQVAFPSFVHQPLLNSETGVIYCDSFTSKIYFINTEKPSDSQSIKLVLNDEAPASVYADPMKFITNQQHYSFFLSFYFADNVLFLSFADKGKENVLIKDFNTNKQIVSHVPFGWFNILFHQNGDLYSCIDPLRILENKDKFPISNDTKYMLEYDGNPVIIKFKSRKL
jgi:hypothetical protein